MVDREEVGGCLRPARIQADQGARQAASGDASFAGQKAAKQVRAGFDAIQAISAPLTADANTMAQLFADPTKCGLSYASIAAFGTGHIDLVKLDGSVVYGYGAAQTMVKVLQMCGDNLTRENVMKQAASLKDFRTEVLLPGIRINTGPNDFAPISQLQLMKFKGEKWELFGEVISADAGG